MKWLPLLVLVPFFTGGGGPQTVIVYGDSLSDANATGVCHWCDELVADGVTIWSAAAGGAETFPAGSTCQAAGYDNCHQAIRYQAARHETTGVCEVGTADSPAGADLSDNNGHPIYGGSQVATCLEDLPIQGQTVAVFQGGTNDVIASSRSGWLSSTFAKTQAAYQHMLGPVESEGVGCVIVIPPPIWENRTEAVTGEYLDINLNIEDIQGYVKGTSSTNLADDMGGSYPEHCHVVDLYQGVLDYEAANGEAAMLALYDDCPAKDSPLSEDCVHFGDDGKDWMGRKVRAAVQKAWGYTVLSAAPVVASGDGSCTFPAELSCTF